MGFDDYKVVLYRQDDGSWVAEVPALGGHALMDTREAALAEVQHVFALIAQDRQERGQAPSEGHDRNRACLARRRASFNARRWRWVS
jgi:predicted RNase H-like HicB family nuclease